MEPKKPRTRKDKSKTSETVYDVGNAEVHVVREPGAIVYTNSNTVILGGEGAAADSSDENRKRVT
jgi:hypothetical protein